MDPGTRRDLAWTYVAVVGVNAGLPWLSVLLADRVAGRRVDALQSERVRARDDRALREDLDHVGLRAGQDELPGKSMLSNR